MKDTLLNQCLEIIKRRDVQNEIKKIIQPFTEIVLTDMYPYIYIIILFVLFIFFIILANLLLLIFLIFSLRNKI
jgi:hypothetical protein